MWKSMKVKSLLIIIMTALAIWRFYPPFDIHDNTGKVVEKGKINLGLDLQGGMHLLLQVDTSNLPPEEAVDATDRALEIIRNRIDQFGVVEPLVQKQGKDRIIIQLPGVTDRERAKEIVGKTAHLEFKLVSDDAELIKQAMDGKVPEGYEIKELKRAGERRTESLLLKKDAVLTGDMLVDATMEFSQQEFGQPYVSLELNQKGGDIFAAVTGENVNKRLAIVLDGEVYTAPVIRERIPSGRAQITGNFSVDEARDIAIVLRAGALPAPVNIIEERSVGAGLGKDSIEKGIRACLYGGAAVLIFLAAYYLFLGLVADLTLVINMILLLGVMAYFKATLSLPGIAGLVLTLGMADDANVLIYERIREELKLGKSLRAAIAAGFDRAFLTIFDSNLTTLIAALMLFQFGTGPVKGFATTLSIGIATSMFTAIIGTRLALDIFTTKFPNLKTFLMMQFFGKTNFKFVKYRLITYAFSLTLIGAGMFAFIQRGEKMYGVDFSGGTLQEFRFKEAVSAQDVRDILSGLGLGESTIQQSGEGREILIRSAERKPDEIVESLRNKFGADSFEVMRVEEVGPTVGADLRQKAIKALLFAMIGICLYVSIRFKFKFAVAAIIATFHDVLITTGLLALTGREISLPVVGAILTVVGYSINDTIVVFDRIRENMRFMRKADLPEIIDTSINQTLSRTVLTSLTTVFVVIALYIWGGKVINDFAFVLMMGIIFGTYSSVFVASPLIVDWTPKRAVTKR